VGFRGIVFVAFYFLFLLFLVGEIVLDVGVKFDVVLCFLSGVCR